MSWWRHESSLSPLQRYAQRLLRSREAALRTRCFSRSPYKATRNNDYDGKQRPPHLSHLEWMQLQHYKRWRKRLSDNPYHAIFGASNDMLSGKGLKDWEWVHRGFPRWLVGELDECEGAKRRPEKPSLDEGDTKSEHASSEMRSNERFQAPTSDINNARYPKRVNITDHDNQIPLRPESRFAQSSLGSSPFDGDDVGISSPSDPRRPQEQHRIDSVEDVSMLAHVSRGVTPGTIPPLYSERISIDSIGIPRKYSRPPSDAASTMDSTREMRTKESAGEPSTPKSSFIKEFHAGEPGHSSVKTSRPQSETTWRQTALQRRSSSYMESWPESRYGTAVKHEEPKSTVQSVQDDIPVMPLPQEMNRELNDSHNTVRNRDEDWLIEQDPPTQENNIVSKNDISPSPPMSKTSNSPSNNDIDRPTAADIRAKIGQKRRDMALEAKKLAEQEFLFRHIISGTSRKVNKQPLWRSISEKPSPRNNRESQQTEQKDEMPKSASEKESPVESSMDRMMKWLEQGSSMLTSHFWQDPTEEADIQKAKMTLDKVVVRVKKGRDAMKQVIEDLKTDIPASQPLLKRLQEDEEVLDSAIQALRLHLTKGQQLAPSARNSKGIPRLHLNLQAAELELDAAYEALREIQQSSAVESASPTFKRRLRIASKISHQNVRLTGHLFWNLRTYAEDAEPGQIFFVKFGPVSSSLFTLRDTQIAIASLVDRAMLVYGVEPLKADHLGFPGRTNETVFSSESYEKQPSHNITSIDKDDVRANVAIEERYANEVETQKLATQELADGTAAKAPEPIQKETFEERSPLAHSLFRPFGPVLKSLCKGIPEQGDPVKEDNAANRIQETKGSAKEPEKKPMSFEMLKDDPASQSILSSTLNSSFHENSREGENIHLGVPFDTTEGHASTTFGVPEHQSALTATAGSSEVGASAQASNAASSDSKIDHASTAHLPTHYTMLIHDPHTGHLSLTTSTTGPPRDSSPTIPIHQALSILNNPSKFVPYINEGLEIVSAKKDMLILRNALEGAEATRAFERIGTSSLSHGFESTEHSRREVNPIDGTVHLSPTGYVGPEESQEQLEQEFQERRQAAGQINALEAMQRIREEQAGKRAGRKEIPKRRGGAGAVIRTVIWAGAFCYVVGVVGEICMSPFRM